MIEFTLFQLQGSLARFLCYDTNKCFKGEKGEEGGGREGVRLAETGDLLQRAAKSKGEFDHGGKCLQETIRKCCASIGLDCFGAVIKRAGKNPE